MKSLIKIYSRYILAAILLILLLLFANIAFFLFTIIHYATYYNGSLITGNMDDIAREMIYIPDENNGNPYLSETGMQLIKQNNYVFVFILSPQGDIVWEWNLPSELPTHYAIGDIASLSKWYLKDYPVKTWRNGDYLMVCGQARHSSWKYNIEMPESFMEHLPYYFMYGIIVNLLIILLVILIAGYRLYQSLRPIANGMKILADGDTVSLPERGITSELCSQLNKTSRILEEQKEELNKRDNARTEWISGVSHDIRTPLSMIMGYADSLSADTSLSDEQRQQTEIVKHQSIVIKKLIEDLNLTSKLEYHMQPLRIEKFKPAPFLRSLVASYLNDGLDSRYDIDLILSENFENIYMQGDKALLSRTINNLIGNSIKHNPGGCHIRITAALLNNKVSSISISDNGIGIPEQIIQILEGKTMLQNNTPHIMGLRIARQIVISHQGNFYFGRDRHSIIMEFPVKNPAASNGE